MIFYHSGLGKPCFRCCIQLLFHITKVCCEFVLLHMPVLFWTTLQRHNYPKTTNTIGQPYCKDILATFNTRNCLTWCQVSNASFHVASVLGSTSPLGVSVLKNHKITFFIFAVSYKQSQEVRLCLESSAS